MLIHNPNNLPTIDFRKVKPLQNNLKDLTDANAERLKNVLDRRGFRQPLNLWKQGETFYLLDGHQRHRVMTSFDMSDKGNYEVPYFLTEAKDEAEAKMQILEISSQYGTVTQEGYDEFVVELPEFELNDTYFEALFHDKKAGDPETEEDEPPAVSPDPPQSVLGAVYQLGRHRLMCGDSTKGDDVAILMDEANADMIFTDPPYNSDYTGKTKEALKIKNDKFDDEEKYSEFLLDSFTAMATASKDGASVYICHPDYRGEIVRKAFREAGFYTSQIIVWNKNSMVMGRQDYHWKHEPILYGWKQGSSHQFYGGRNQVSVWDMDRPTKSLEHPTMKPIALCAKAINNSSKPDDLVLDLFGGSGSTLIACEQLKRICYMAELDPKYVDVIRKRYHKFVTDSDEGWIDGTPKV